MKKLQPLFVFLIVVAICAALLICSLLVPQKPVSENLKDSLTQLNVEGNNPTVFDSTSDANMLDNTTDALMLMQTYYSSDWNALWKNVWNRHEDGTIAGLNAAVMESSPANFTYSRYWGGFRVTLRPLLAIFNYMQIRHINASIFFLLFAIVLLVVCKYSDSLCAVAFALSIILVKPEIISNSPHFACCFLIAFLSMIMIPLLLHRNVSLPVIFVTIGCLTQFFDYYTAPVITFVYPFIMVMLVKESKAETCKDVHLFQSFAAWFASWAGMWLVKLTLTTIFTDENAFVAAFASASRRLGFDRIEGLEYSYNPLSAVIAVFRTLFQSPIMLVFISGVLIAFIASCAFKLKPKCLNITKNIQYLYVAIIPILWYVCTCSPTVLHAFFQYRGLAGCVFASLVYIVHLMKKEQAMIDPVGSEVDYA